MFFIFYNNTISISTVITKTVISVNVFKVNMINIQLPSSQSEVRVSQSVCLGYQLAYLCAQCRNRLPRSAQESPACEAWEGVQRVRPPSPPPSSAGPASQLGAGRAISAGQLGFCSLRAGCSHHHGPPLQAHYEPRMKGSITTTEVVEPKKSSLLLHSFLTHHLIMSHDDWRSGNLPDCGTLSPRTLNLLEPTS